MNPEGYITQSSNGYQQPVTSTALVFWEQGKILLLQAEEYRRTDWQKCSALIWKGIRLQAASYSLDTALRLQA